MRDAEGNVVDIILPEDDNEGEAGKEGETVGEDSDEEGKEVAPVPAKTEVVKSQSSSPSSPPFVTSPRCSPRPFRTLSLA